MKAFDKDRLSADYSGHQKAQSKSKYKDFTSLIRLITSTGHAGNMKCTEPMFTAISNAMTYLHHKSELAVTKSNCVPNSTAYLNESKRVSTTAKAEAGPFKKGGKEGRDT